jgi:hypothetical protein
MNPRRFFTILAVAAATAVLSSCLIVRPILVAIEGPDVIDDSIPEEELAYVHFDDGFIPVSCNGIPIDELSRHSDDDRSLFGSEVNYHYLAIPAGKAEIIGNISFAQRSWLSTKVYTASGAGFVFNFKPGGDYIVELVFEDNEFGVDIFAGTKGYYYDIKDHLARIMF